MNKEMVEIMEIKEDLKKLKASTQEELSKMLKKVQDNKTENKKLIESRFEEILDTVKFSIDNNPNVAGSSRKSTSNELEKIVNKTIEAYEKGKDEEIDQLSAIVEEITDKLIEENKTIKSKIKDLAKDNIQSDIESALSNTNKISK